MQFISNFIERKTTKETLEHFPTVEKLQKFFEHCARRSVKSFADYSFTFKGGIGSLISWHLNEFCINGTGHVAERNIPSHLKWSSHPVYAFLSVENEKICYYYSDDCSSEIYDCKVTDDPNHIKMINELFDYYYKRFVLQDTTSITDL